jgi:hypothetical protein
MGQPNPCLANKCVLKIAAALVCAVVGVAGLGARPVEARCCCPAGEPEVHVALTKAAWAAARRACRRPVQEATMCKRQAAYGDSQRSAAPHSLCRGRAMRLPGPAGPPCAPPARGASRLGVQTAGRGASASLSVLRLRWRMTCSGISPPRSGLLSSGGCGGCVLGLWGRSRLTRMARWYGDAPGVPQ